MTPRNKEKSWKDRINHETHCKAELSLQTRSSSVLIMFAEYSSIFPSIFTTPSTRCFVSRSIAMAVPLFGTNSRLYYDKYLTHPTNSPKPHLLPSLHSSFTPNWKHCSLANPILIHPPPHTFLVEQSSRLLILLYFIPNHKTSLSNDTT